MAGVNVTVRNIRTYVTIRNIEMKPKRTPRPRTAYHHGDLANAALAAALELVEQRGVDAFALAEVAKRLGVSTAALYRHFADRGALLAAVARDSFRMLDDALRAAGPAAASSKKLLRALTDAYLDFAFAHPARYSLMFGAGRAPKEASVEQAADDALALVVEALAAALPDVPKAKLESAATHVWSLCHGLVSLWLAGVLEVSSAEVHAIAWDGVAKLLPTK